ncbi:Uncharacterized protein EJ110_NYTH05417 [Nymphaea thermarum]|nr:Uncharacterized protein EJ110_NYTH05417 [Nymphaea thermarum]
MGNAIMLGGKRRVRLMKIDGETLKLKAPVLVRDVVQQHPNHVVMDAESVRKLGPQAKPLDDDHELKGGKKLYFLVELPKLPEERVPRRVRSGIQMGAKERLESLMLAKRSVSDLTFVKGGGGGEGEGAGVMRVKMRLPKSQVASLVGTGADGAEVAEKIIDMCLKKEENPLTASAGAAVAEGNKSGNLCTSGPGGIQEGACAKNVRPFTLV